MDEALAFLDPQFRPSVCLAAYGFVVAFKGEWAHSNWEKFLAEEVAATGLGDLADDPAQRNALGSFLEELKALYHEEGEEAFARRMEEVREEVFKPSQPTGLLAVVGSNILGFWKSLLDWFRHLWAAELKAESLPRGIPLAVRGLLGTLFPVIKLKYVFVLIAAVFVGGWGTNALRYRAVVNALDARQFEAAQQAAAVLEESFLSRIHAFNPLEAFWLRPAFGRLMEEQVSFGAYEEGELARLGERIALFTDLPGISLLDLSLEEHQDEVRWNDQPTPARDLMAHKPGLALLSSDGALQTVILEVWAWRALRKRPHPRFGTIPVVVDLADFVGDADDLANHIVATLRASSQSHGVEIPGRVVRQRAAEGGFLLVVTRLEASGDPIRTAEAVRSLISDVSWRNNRWWVGYRIEFARRSLRPSLSPLTEVWVAKFQEAELAGVVRDAIPQAPDAVVADLRRTPRVARALRNPLVMAMFLKQYRRNRTVPHRLGSFYRAVTLEALSSSRTEDEEGEALSPQAKEYLLGKLAETIGPRRETLPRFEAEAALAQTLKGRLKEPSVSVISKASKAMEVLLQTDLIVADSSATSWSSGYQVRFLLPSFREYFHATAVARRLPGAEREGKAEAELAPFLDDPAMQYAASFLVGLVEDATIIFDLLLARLRRAMSEEFPKASRRYLRLSARLLPSAMGVDGATVDELTEELVAQAREASFTSDRERALKVLGYVRNSAAHSALLEGLRDRDARVRRAAVVGLQRGGGAEAVGPLVAALKDKDPSVQAGAAAALALAPRDRVVPALDALMDGEAPALRTRVVTVLGQVGGRGATVALEKALADENRLVRRFAARALGKLARPESQAALSRLLKDSDVAVRAEAAHALGAMKASSVVAPLREALGDESLRVRRAAAEALGEVGTKDAVAAIRNALNGSSVLEQRGLATALGRARSSEAQQTLQRLLANGAPVVQSAAVQALGRMSGPRSVEVLTEALQGMDVSVRREAAATLRRLRDRRAIPTLKGLLTDPDHLIRAEAVQGLGDLADHAARNSVAMCATDGDAEVRRVTAEALGRIGGDATDGVLARLVVDEVAEVRAAALGAYAARPDRAQEDLFIRALDDPDPGVRYSSAAALERYPSSKAIAALIAHAADPDPFARREIVRVLGLIGEERAVSVLLERLVEADPSIRAEAARSLKRVGPLALPALEAVLALEMPSDPVAEELYDVSVSLDAKINRRSPTQLAAVADRYVEHMQWRRALTLYKAALGLAETPGRKAKLHAAIGDVLKALGDSEAAREAYQRSLALDPYNRRAQEALEVTETARRQAP